MKRMMLLILCLLLAPLCAQAEFAVDEAFHPDGSLSWRSIVFGSIAPPLLQDVLMEAGFGDAAVVAGASVEAAEDQLWDMENEYSAATHSAVVMLESDGQKRLIGLWQAEDRNWMNCDLSPRIPLPSAIGVHDREDGHPMFCLPHINSGNGAYSHLELQNENIWHISRFNSLYEHDMAFKPQERTLTFASSCPEQVRAQLDAGGYGDATVLCGAGQEHMWTDMYNFFLLLAERGGQRSLIGLQWVNGRDERYICEYSRLPWDLSQLTAIEVIEDPDAPDSCRFALPFPDGSSYEIAFGLGTGWRLHGYNAPDGTQIAWASGEMIVNGESFPSTYSAWLNDLPAVRAFPTSRGEAVEIARRSWEGLDDPSLALGTGHLRASPGASSRSLGRYTKAKMQILAQQDGWFQVRIGDTVGWMSGVYVHRFVDREDLVNLHNAMPTAIARAACPLRSSMDGGAQLRQLSTGEEMRILAQTEDGWLHVLVPDGALGWELAMDGTYGYVRREEVDANLTLL